MPKVERTPPPASPGVSTAPPAPADSGPSSEESTTAASDNPKKTVRTRKAQQKSSMATRKQNKEPDISGTVLETSIEKLKKLFTSSMAQQEAKMGKLMFTVKEIKEQNDTIRKSLDFITQEYDELKKRFGQYESERKENLVYIKSLESRIDTLERNERASSLEVRNVPLSTGENKDKLCQLMQNLGNRLDIPIQRNSIRNIFRIKSKIKDVNPIIVEFGSVVEKEEITNRIKRYKRDKKLQLTTATLGIEGAATPIFISENLPTKNKRLFSLTREFAKTQGYKFCWTAYGSIYLRKTEDQPAIRITNDKDLIHLKNKI